MKRSDAIHELAIALAKAQGEMEPALKSAFNPHFKSKYVDLAAVRLASKAPLARNGLAVIQSPEVEDDMFIVIETMLVHASGQWVSTTLKLPFDKMSAQSIGSAITYGRRYGIMAILGIAGEDDDGNASSGAVDERAPKQISRPVDRDLMVEAEHKADEGFAVLSSWWTELDSADRKRFTTEDTAALKKRAYAVDAAKAAKAKEAE